MCNEEREHCGVCKIPNFERNNYYYGKLMTVRDLFAEQCYFNERRWLINRMVNGWGVVCGLDVQRKSVDPDDPSQGYFNDRVVITPGLAIDCCGHEILVCDPQDVELIPTEDECRGNTGQTPEPELYIGLEFWECKTEEVQIAPAACGQGEKCEFNRLRDSFKKHVFRPGQVTVAQPQEGLCPLTKLCPLKIFKLTAQSLENLRNKIPDKILEKLQCLKDQEFIGRKEFLDAVEEQIREELNDKDKELILTHVETVIDLRRYLCEKMKDGCPQCPELPRNHAVILAKVTRILDKNGNVTDIDIEACPIVRRQVYSSKMLFDLINCYHGDLPHIEYINWHDYHQNPINDVGNPDTPNKEMDWDTFIDMIGGPDQSGTGLHVTFDRDVKGVNENTFLLLVDEIGRRAGYIHKIYIPGNVSYDSETQTAIFKVTSDWYNDEIVSTHSLLLEGADFQVILRGDHIVDQETGRALDANFIGGELPSGNGTQGGNFVSWFKVSPRTTSATKR